MTTNAVPIDVEGISYRQLDYWANQGYLKPDHNGEGSGISRSWPDEEIQVARMMIRLRAAGLTLDAAHNVARGQLELAPGVWVLVDPERGTDATQDG